MAKSRTLNVNEASIAVIQQNETDCISLTDMTVSFKEGSGLIGKWITNKNTLEYLGVWEKIKNQNFNHPEFGVIGQDLSQSDRLVQLNKVAITQMKSLLESNSMKKLK